MDFDLIVRGGTLPDGRIADIAVAGETIAAIEPELGARAGREVDAQGDPEELDAAGSGNFHNALDSEGFNACSLYGMRKRGFTQSATVRAQLLESASRSSLPEIEKHLRIPGTRGDVFCSGATTPLRSDG